MDINILNQKNDIKIINTPKLNINFLFPFKIVKLLYLIFYSYLILKKENRLRQNRRSQTEGRIGILKNNLFEIFKDKFFNLSE